MFMFDLANDKVVCVMYHRMNLLWKAFLEPCPSFPLVAGRGNWSAEGCGMRRMDNITGLITCECNHLTNFAILVVSSHKEAIIQKNLFLFPRKDTRRGSCMCPFMNGPPAVMYQFGRYYPVVA